MTDQEKTEAAALSWKQQPDGSVGYCVDCFKAGVAWRDRNPGPHVMALVEALQLSVPMHESTCAMEREDKISRCTCWVKKRHNSLAQFEKAMEAGHKSIK